MHMLKSAVRGASTLLVISGGLLASGLLAGGDASAQAPNPYAAPINVDVARRAAVAAIVEGKKNGWTVAAAVVDSGGALVYFERIDGTQYGSSDVAIAKARSAAAFKRPTKAFEEAVAGGRNAILSLPGAIPLEGGIPIILDGKIVGALGVSGATSQQDGVCAQAGVNSVAPPAKAAPAPPAKK
ncbi:MAG TPA: heme-binding protein [Polyangiaceae bacterium]|nr:heme-binding protein [Polyangiaceae bacterium]